MGKKFRRFITLLLTLAMVVTSAMPSSAVRAAEKTTGKGETGYTDIDGSKYKGSLEYAVKYNLLTSDTDKINPSKRITRADVIMAAVALLGGGTPSESIEKVKDIDKDHYAYEAFAIALNLGLVSPSKSGKLYPDKKASNEYVAKIFARLTNTTQEDMLENITYKKSMTRGKFAKFLRINFPNIITKSTSKIADGNVVMNTPGVKLKNVTVKGNLIIGEGIGDKSITLQKVKVEGEVYVRTGKEESVKITGKSSITNITYKQDDVDIDEGEIPAGTPDETQETTPAVTTQPSGDSGLGTVYIYPTSAPYNPVAPTAAPTAKPTVEPTPKPEGRKEPIVATFGSPKIDAEIDSEWANAEYIDSIVSTGSTNTTAKFRVMWDDLALYFLAEVSDSVINTGSGSAYEQDSVEIYLDELCDSIKGMVADNPDDLQFRISCLNAISGDAGDTKRLTSAAKITETGYIVEARVAFTKTTPVNDKEYRMEFSVNDAGANNSRIATLNVFDNTNGAYSNTGLFGKLILTGRTDESLTRVSTGELENYMAEVAGLELERYTESTAKAVTAAYDAAQIIVDSVAASEGIGEPTQAEVDAALANLKTAFKALKHDTNKVFDEKECLPIPDEYTKVMEEGGGTIVTVNYDTFKYESDGTATGSAISKQMNVYLPAGYDADDKDTKYNVFYLVHGGGENWQTLFGGPGENFALKVLLDNMIANGDIEPMIVVTPDQNTPNNYMRFWAELENDIIPYTDANYNTIADRDHRAQGGFSMGSMCTWNIYANCINEIKYFVPCSAGMSISNEALIDVASKAGFSKEEHYIFNATGTADFASGGQRATCQWMKENENSSFTYSADLSKGNFYFIDFPGGTHHWTYIRRYLYNIMPDLFFAENAKEKAAEENMVVTNYGTPEIDGVIDDIWNKAVEIKAENVIGNPVATAAFKTLWDDNALYILAEVKDTDLDSSSFNAHEKDSIEFFLDEFNENSGRYDSNDYQLRINYLNEISGSNGIADRVTSKVIVTEGVGYVIEARIAFLGLPKNYKVSGTEFALNDASGGSRIGMRKGLGTTDNAYSTTNVFGKMMYMGKKYSDVTSLDLTNIKKALDAAAKLDNEVSKKKAVAALLSECVDRCNAAMTDETSTKESLDSLVSELNSIVKAINDIQNALIKAESIDADMYTAESVLVLTNCVSDCTEALAAESITVDALVDLGNDISAAMNALVRFYPVVTPITAVYGSPLIDGVVDAAWSKAENIKAYVSQNNPNAKATFKILWDDNALYVLADITDYALGASASNVYEQDSIEIYLDEKHDSSNIYGTDDIHFRVNYLNEQSADDGDLTRFITATKVKEDGSGYLIEARISFLGDVANDSKSGIEFSVNDATGGSRIGTLNAFDFTGMAYDNPTLFNEVTFIGKEEGDAPSANPYDLVKAIEEADEIWLDYYTTETADAVKTAADTGKALKDKVFAGEAVAQQDINDALTALTNAIAGLVRDDSVHGNLKEARRIPTAYNYASENVEKGRLVEVFYEAPTYNNGEAVSGSAVETSMMVYLPAGYDQEDTETKYNVFYYVHGNAESQYKVFGKEDDQTFFVNVVDHMIANGQLEPMIIVTPTWYGPNSYNSFYSELFYDIIPTIEGKYNTYTGRDHRALGGFSAGSMSLFSTFGNGGLNYFKYFVPISASTSGAADVVKTVSESAISYDKTDYYFFGASGTKDFGNSLKNVILGLDAFDQFTCSTDLSVGNAYYVELIGGTHIFNCAARYLYNIMPDLFFAENQKPIDPTEPTVTPEPTVPPVPEGREEPIVANFGSPKVDGVIDDIWSTVEAASFVKSGENSNPEATAEVKVLWDDNALYYLAEVTDADLDGTNGEVYNRDGVEVYLDENNDSVGGAVADNMDDIHFRTTYVGDKSADAGDITRFYAAVSKPDGGYIVEGRVSFTKQHDNYDLMGIEFSVNDAKNGSRIGTLNVYDATGQAYAHTDLFGKVKLEGRTSESITNLNIYDLKNFMQEANAVETERYTEATAKVLINAIEVANGYIAAEADAEAADPSQADVDKALADLKAAIKNLVKDNNKVFDTKDCLPIPEDYRTVAVSGGSIVSINYPMHKYSTTGAAISESTNHMNVYLPYGYEEAAAAGKRYPVFYLLHGGSESENTIFGGPDQNLTLKNVIDHMIMNGDIEPMIVVTPTWNVNRNENFGYELSNDIIKYIDANYSTIAQREYRATGGFSMGSMTTWYDFTKCLSDIKYFVPVSMGTLYGFMGAKSYEIIDTIQALGFTSKEDYYVFSASGTDDSWYDSIKSYVQEIRDDEDFDKYFSYSADLSKGNIYFLDFPGGTHHWSYVNRYLYNILPDLFFAENAKDKATAENMVITNYGTPEIDGVADEVWNKAVEIKAENVIGSPVATATFKTLWDDNALYLLADVKDTDLDSSSFNAHEKDSIEFFLDEFNENSGRYDSNDYQLRINYLNEISGTGGIADRVTSKVFVTEGVGYVIEAKITFLGMPKNYKVSGTEFALNDASAGSRIGMLKTLGTTDNAYSTTNVFGKMMYMGKGYDETTALNFEGLNNILTHAKAIDTSKYTVESVEVLNACIAKCEAALTSETITQAEINTLVKELKAAIAALALHPIKAEFGTPRIDGVIGAEEWTTETAAQATALISSGSTDTTANFTVMWDDDALYVLAKVSDAVLNDANGNSWEKDGVEIFLDEENNGGSFGDKDVHFRITFNNEQFADKGNLDRLYSKTAKVEGGYIVEARIAFIDAHVNGNISGIELAVNDANASGSRIATMNVYDSTNGAYNNIDLLGNVEFQGREEDDVTGLNPYALMKAIEKAYAVRGEQYTAETYDALMDYVDVCELMLEDPTATQADIDNCLSQLNMYLTSLELVPMYAEYGTPEVDGIIDDIWDEATAVYSVVSGSNPKASGKFRVMWDDYSLFILAEITDPSLDKSSGTVYNRDCIEIFFDELFDRTERFGSDDVQFRISYENSVSADAGDPGRLYSAAKTVDGGYVIEASIDLLKLNGEVSKVSGIEFAVNDAEGGNRIGTLGVFDSTGSAYSNTGLFGKLELRQDPLEIVKVNNYKLRNLVIEANEIELERYTEETANAVTSAAEAAGTVIGNAAADQAQVDDAYTVLYTAIKALKHNDTKLIEKENRRIPQEYRLVADNKGTIETREYMSNGSAKQMNVYLPYGYDAADTTTKYPVLYLIHGGGENWITLFGGVGVESSLKCLLDNMIANGDLDPLIVVTPDQNAAGSSNFYSELSGDVIPFIDTEYNTIADREHRAAGGFSMGSMATWNVYRNCLELIKYYVPCSAFDGSVEDTAQAARDFFAKGYDKYDQYIFNCTGTDDIAGGGHNNAVQQLKTEAYNDCWTYSADLENGGNMYFIYQEGATHHWNYINRYLYNILPDLFFAEK